MRALRNEKGIAMVTALLFTMISLAMVLAVLYMISQGSKITAAQKMYKNSLEATKGGVDLTTQTIIPEIYRDIFLFGNITSAAKQVQKDLSSIQLAIPVSSKCLDEKLNRKNSQWANCSADNKNSDPKIAPDMSFHLRGVSSQPGFNVFAKIVDNINGERCNTDKSGMGDSLMSGAAVVGSLFGGGAGVPSVPCVYRLELEGERESNAKEKASLSVLYAY